MARRRSHKWFANFVLIGVIAIAGYVVIISSDIRPPEPFSFINPPDTRHTIILRFNIFFGQKPPIITPDIDLVIFLEFSGTLTAGTTCDVLLGGIGRIGPNATLQLDLTMPPERVEKVQVYFQLSHAFPARNDKNGYPMDDSLKFSRVNETSNDIAASNVTIYWPIPGDFSPTVIAFSKDYVSQELNFPIQSVHVEPESVRSNEKFSRVNQGLTLALTYFAMIEAFSIYLEYREESPPKKKSQPEPQEHKPSSQTA